MPAVISFSEKKLLSLHILSFFHIFVIESFSATVIKYPVAVQGADSEFCWVNNPSQKPTPHLIQFCSTNDEMFTVSFSLLSNYEIANIWMDIYVMLTPS